MKKTVSLLVVLMLMLSAFCVNVNADVTFLDVPENHWAYSEIQYFYDAVVIDGVGNGMFAPNDNVTREQFAKMISKIYEKSYYGYKPEVQTFSDVTPDRWSYNYIESVKEYLTGYYPEGGQAFFNPEGIATREDVAYALVKIGGLDKEYGDSEVVLKYYSDSDEISPHLRKYVAIAVQAGLLKGYDGYVLKPNAGITRAETVTLLFRAIKRPVAEDSVVEEPEKEPENQEEVKEEIKEEIKEDVKGIKITDIERISGYRNVKGTINVAMGDEPFFKANMKCYEGLLANVVECKIELIEAEECTDTEINGIFKVMYDDVVKHKAIEGTVTLKNGKLTFDAESDNYNLVAYTDDYVKEEESKEQEKNEDEPKEEVRDKYIYYDVKEFDGENADGTLMLHYKDNEGFAEIEDFNVIVGNDIYEYDVIDVSKNSSGSISVKYTLKFHNDVIEENKICKFEDYAKGLGEYAKLDIVKMQIIEIEG